MNIALKWKDIIFAFCIHETSHLIIGLFVLSILYWMVLCLNVLLLF